jgi:hypothetical protein
MLPSHTHQEARMDKHAAKEYADHRTLTQSTKTGHTVYTEHIDMCLLVAKARPSSRAASSSAAPVSRFLAAC